MTSTMKAWQYSTSSGNLETNIGRNDDATMPPSPSAEKPEMLVEVISMALNPADYKLAEMGLLSTLMISLPATPGMDFSGRVVTLGAPTDLFKVGDLVFGRLEPTQCGTLGQFVLASYDGCAPLPDGIDPDHGAAIGTAGLTAYQTIVPHVKPGDSIFLNGGSGGLGSYGIQIAKAIGCHVTTSCSTSKIALCKQYGADEVIEYTATNVTQTLIERGTIYSLVVDNVGSSPSDLYSQAEKFLLPTGKFIQVGGGASFATVKTYMSRMLLPRFMGGGSRKFETYFTHNSREDLEKIAAWVLEGKVKIPVERVFGFEDVPQAIMQLKGGRSTGKIVVCVSSRR